LNLAREAELAHQIAGALEIVRKRRDLECVVGRALHAIRPELRELPPRVIQQHSSEREKPAEEEQVQA
jgi:hypothetical protein